MNRGRMRDEWRMWLLGLVAMVVFLSGVGRADSLNDVDVIDGLDLPSLEAGKVHRFYLRTSETSVGQPWLVPVVVVKGAAEGPTLGLNAAIHGDELNGIGVIHALLETLDPTSLAGTVVAIPGMNIPGLLDNNRNMPASNGGGYSVNLNRIMPSSPDDEEPAAQYAWRVWSGVFSGRMDAAIDVHTQTRGTAYPLYVFVDQRNTRAARMARLLGPDMIKIDPGLEGTLETTFIKAGIPAVTLEVGEAKRFQPDLIRRAVVGIRRVMIDMNMLEDRATAITTDAFVGNDARTIGAPSGGIATILVDLGQPVEVGQEVAVIRNQFGDVIARVASPVEGRILAVATDPLREPGALLVRVLWNNPESSCRNGC